MAGFCGIIGIAGPDAAHQSLRRMLPGISGCGKLHYGALYYKEISLGIAWAVREDSFADCLPIWNEKKNCLLIFIGNHIADKDEIAELKRKNHQVRKPNASYLIHLYEEKGDAFVR